MSNEVMELAGRCDPPHGLFSLSKERRRHRERHEALCERRGVQLHLDLQPRPMLSWASSQAAANERA